MAGAGHPPPAPGRLGAADLRPERHGLLGLLAREVLARHGLFARPPPIPPVPAPRRRRAGRPSPESTGTACSTLGRPSVPDAVRGRVRPSPGMRYGSRRPWHRSVSGGRGFGAARSSASPGCSRMRKPRSTACGRTAGRGAHPLGPSRRLVDRSRLIRVGREAMDVQARDAGTTVIHPFLDPVFRPRSRVPVAAAASVTAPARCTGCSWTPAAGSPVAIRQGRFHARLPGRAEQALRGRLEGNRGSDRPHR